MLFADAAHGLCEMPIPVRHTFIHFAEDLFEKAALERNATCPRNFAPAAEVMAKSQSSAAAPSRPVSEVTAKSQSSAAAPTPPVFEATPLRLRGGRRTKLGGSLEFILANKDKEQKEREQKEAFLPGRAKPMRTLGTPQLKKRLTPPEKDRLDRLGTVPEEDASTEAANSTEAASNTSMASEEESETQTRSEGEAQTRSPVPSPAGRVTRSPAGGNLNSESNGWTQVPMRKKDRREPSTPGMVQSGTVKEEEADSIASSGDGESQQEQSEEQKTPQETSANSGGWERVERPARGGYGGQYPREYPREEGAWAKRSSYRYAVGIPQCEEFNVMRRLLVPLGGHMRKVAEATGAKLCVRGRGSGHLEGPERKEAAEPLMVCITSSQTANVPKASAMIEDVIRNLQSEYREFKRKKGEAVPEMRITLL